MADGDFHRNVDKFRHIFVSFWFRYSPGLKPEQMVKQQKENENIVRNHTIHYNEKEKHTFHSKVQRSCSHNIQFRTATFV
jgi:hypothetical protein